ncbi:hypothetical protein G6F46_004236 [Rhizopus delemar]|uniref:Nuclear pore complex protein Nup85 n=2 Tax=Rhizopus TaxID=4842 RepID=A0A9P7CQD1_9FUNG|nr:hypothetical protein G6F55_002984 [Rhizopus delemar]KAG1551118.1 hypothetical protein G6F51_002046 [Rhizopus arrhizus]KAG1493718.1 hypothetical protein G6F54_008380 [Rhizopus delemar]KAG1507965.1 hypothetical protein G6F53_008548 [Rhizopus delemar]KAG1523191.1 hypothetical protein G6F52_005223 [Rhizopus delemar]
MGLNEFLKEACKAKLENIPESRQLLYIKSANIFRFLNESSVDSLAEQYTNVLGEYIQHLEQFYDAASIQERKYMLELQSIWELCQILYFQKEQPCQITQLLDWQSKVFQRYLWEYDRYNIHISTLKNKDFWPFAYRLVLFGQLDSLSNLLSAAISTFPTDLVPFLKEIQSSLSQPDRHSILHPLLAQLKQQEDTKDLVILCNLLLGDIRTISRHAVHPVQIHIASRLYNNTTTPSYASEGGRDLLESLMIGDIYSAFSFCVQHDWWLIVHLCFLFSKKQMLDRSIQVALNDGSMLELKCTDYFTVFYASSLMNGCGAWKDGFYYLLACEETGKLAINEHLKRMEFENEIELKKMVNFCVDHELKGEGLAIYERKALKYLDLKEYQNAIDYFELAERFVCFDMVLIQVIQDYSSTGTLVELDIKERPEKTVYTKVYSYLLAIKQSVNESDYTAAGREFRDLVQLVTLPDWIISLVYQEGVKLVEKKGDCLELDVLLSLKEMWKELQCEENSLEFDLFLDTSSITLSRAIDRQSE